MLSALGFKDIYQFIVTFIASLLGISVATELLDVYTSMFLLLCVFTIPVLVVEYAVLVMERRFSVLDFALPIIKGFCAIGIFVFFSVWAIVSDGIDSATEGVFYFLTWAYTGVVVSAYMIQILTFGKRIGIPGMGKIIDIVESMSSIFTKFQKK